MTELKSRSQMRRVAVQDPDVLIKEIETLRRALEDHVLKGNNPRFVELKALRHEVARQRELLKLLYQEFSECEDAELALDWAVRIVRDALKEQP